MAETHPKRQRQESHDTEGFEFEPANSNPKRQKTYSNMLSFLDEEEEDQEPNQDFSAILTSLQQELSSSESTATTITTTTFDFDSFPYAEEEVAELAHEHHLTTGSDDCRPMSGGGSVEDEGEVSVMRHLLEASDAELGIPNSGENIVASSSEENFPFAFTDGLWDLEDEATNYFTVLQSELFM